jgi:hypothetical protein
VWSDIHILSLAGGLSPQCHPYDCRHTSIFPRCIIGSWTGSTSPFSSEISSQDIARLSRCPIPSHLKYSR